MALEGIRLVILIISLLEYIRKYPSSDDAYLNLLPMAYSSFDF